MASVPTRWTAAIRTPSCSAATPSSHALHLFVREALVSFVVEPRDLLCVGVITNDSMEDANAAGSRVLDGFSDLVE